MIKSTIALSLNAEVLFHIKPIDAPVSKYMIPHAIGNTILGGVSEDFSKSGYHVSREGVCMNFAVNPIAKHTIIPIIEGIMNLNFEFVIITNFILETLLIITRFFKLGFLRKFMHIYII